MKKTILLFAATLLLSFGLQAQTQEWVFGNDVTNFPVNGGIATNATKTVNGLLITAGATASITNMGAITASAKSLGTYSYINRFQFNGGGYTSAAAGQATPTVNMPIQRYISFSVSGNSTITAYGITGSNTSERKLFVTDGTNLIGTMTFPVTTGPMNEAIVDYTGPATTLYMYCNASINLYDLKVANYQSPSISSFTIPNSSVSTIITAAGSITAKMPFGTNLTALVPTIALTGIGNTVNPASGATVDFTNPVNFTVSDASLNSKTYSVTVTNGPTLDISSFTVGGVTATIDPVAYTINATLPTGTVLTTLQPVVVLAGVGTTVSPVSGVSTNFGSSFTTPVSYTVTDGSFTKVYKVTIVDAVATGINQPKLSGVSFDGQVIHNDGNLDLMVFDTTGRLMTRSSKNINMSSAAKGIYFVKSTTGTLKIAL